MHSGFALVGSFIVAGAAVSLLGCSSQPKQETVDSGLERSPAQMMMTPQQTQELKALLQMPAPDAVAALEADFERYVTLFSQGLYELKRFDEDLAKLNVKDGEAAPDPKGFESYHRLVVLRAAIAAQRRHLEATYAQLTLWAHTNEPNSESRTPARKLRLQIHRYLTSQRYKPPMLALAPLVTEFQALRENPVTPGVLPGRGLALQDGPEKRRAGDLDPELIRMSQQLTYLSGQWSAALGDRGRSTPLFPEVTENLNSAVVSLRAPASGEVGIELSETPSSPWGRDGWGFAVGDGPVEKEQREALEWMQTKKLNVIYLVSSRYLRRQPNLYSELSQKGMNLGVAPATAHPLWPSPTANELRWEVGASRREVEAVSSQKPQWVGSALPVALRTSDELKFVSSLGLNSLPWTVDAVDDLDFNPDSIARRVQNQMRLRDNGVIRITSLRQPAAVAIRRIVERSKKF